MSDEAVRSATRIGLVGHGYFAEFHARAWRRLCGAELVGLATLDKNAATAFAERHSIASIEHSIPALVEAVRPNLIDIVTPPETHATLIRQCAEAHVPLVVCQKPFCHSLAEAEALLEALAGSNTRVVVHENFRFQPWYTEIKRLLEQGALGELYEIRFDLRPGDGRGNDAYLDRQPYFREQPEFLIRETGVHFVDLFRYLVGDIRGLFARLSQLNPVISGEDACLVLFEFSNGARGVLDGNRLADHAAKNPRRVMGEMRIEGSSGCLTLNGDGDIALRAHGSDHAVPHPYSFDDIDFGGDCVYRCCEALLAHQRDGAPVINAADEYLINRRIESVIYASHRDERWYDLP